MIQISLHESGPPFWFFGNDIKHPVAHLSISNPGPIDLDFEGFTLEQQKIILLAIQAEKIVSSVSFDELYSVYQNKEKKFTETSPITPPPVVQEYLQKQEQNVVEQKQLKTQAQIVAKERKFQERCAYISSMNFKTIRSAVKSEKDIRLFQTLLKLEKMRTKPRNLVISYINERLKELQYKLDEYLNHVAENTPEIPSPQSQTTNVSDVVESEVEEITISSEMLEKFAMGNSL